jgi:hypothetical protein
MLREFLTKLFQVQMLYKVKCGVKMIRDSEQVSIRKGSFDFVLRKAWTFSEWSSGILSTGDRVDTPPEH